MAACDPVKEPSFEDQYHPSITNIKHIMKSKNVSSFSLQPISIEKVKNTIKTLNTKRACLEGDIPVKLTEVNEEIFSLIFQNFNQSLVNWDFPHCCYEKFDKSNSRPARILPVASKIYERLMYNQKYILIKSSLNFNAVFVKYLALKAASYI